MDDATEICNAISRYCRGVDDRDFDELTAILAEDVVFDMGVKTTTSRAELFDHMAENLWPKGKHVYVTPVISVNGETALFRSDWFGPTPGGWIVWSAVSSLSAPISTWPFFAFSLP